jgi:NhaP-type Na+/H+ and K+/H+ antiporters
MMHADAAERNSNSLRHQRISAASSRTISCSTEEEAKQIATHKQMSAQLKMPCTLMKDDIHGAEEAGTSIPAAGSTNNTRMMTMNAEQDLVGEDISTMQEEIKSSLGADSHDRKGQGKNITEKSKCRANWKSALQCTDSTIEFLGRFLVVVWFLILVNLICQQMGLDQSTLTPFRNISRLWLCSLVGGYVAKQLHLPPLLGMLAAGLLGVNISDNLFGIPETWRVIFTSAGLSIVLLRSGLELDLPSVGKSKLLTFRLTLIPGVVEALASGLMAVVTFGMPIWLGLSLGFILAAVSPAVVVTSMLDLQHKGYGAQKGIPSLIIAAASFDDIVAIGGFSICIGMAIHRHDTSLISSALHGPFSVIYGILIGIIAGGVMSV